MQWKFALKETKQLIAAWLEDYVSLRGRFSWNTNSRGEPHTRLH
jgi:hypothetical protein